MYNVKFISDVFLRATGKRFETKVNDDNSGIIKIKLDYNYDNIEHDIYISKIICELLDSRWKILQDLQRALYNRIYHFKLVYVPRYFNFNVASGQVTINLGFSLTDKDIMKPDIHYHNKYEYIYSDIQAIKTYTVFPSFFMHSSLNFTYDTSLGRHDSCYFDVLNNDILAIISKKLITSISLPRNYVRVNKDLLHFSQISAETKYVFNNDLIWKGYYMKDFPEMYKLIMKVGVTPEQFGVSYLELYPLTQCLKILDRGNPISYDIIISLFEGTDLDRLRGLGNILLAGGDYQPLEFFYWIIIYHMIYNFKDVVTIGGRWIEYKLPREPGDNVSYFVHMVKLLHDLNISDVPLENDIPGFDYVLDSSTQTSTGSVFPSSLNPSDNEIPSYLTMESPKPIDMPPLVMSVPIPSLPVPVPIIPITYLPTIIPSSYYLQEISLTIPFGQIKK